MGGLELQKVEDFHGEIRDADLVVLLQPHDAVLASGALEGARYVLDTSGSLVGDNVERL